MPKKLNKVNSILNMRQNRQEEALNLGLYNDFISAGNNSVWHTANVKVSVAMLNLLDQYADADLQKAM